MSAFDWPGLMRAGIGGLRLAPAEFWAMTPAELALLLGRDGVPPAPVSRAGLETLARRFPDKGDTDDDDG